MKIKFRSSADAGGEGVIYYQITKDKKVRRILTDYHVYPEEWDASRSMVTTTPQSIRRMHILSIRQRIIWDMERLMKIDGRLDSNGLPYSTKDIIDEYGRYANDYTLFNYMENIIDSLKQKGRMRTAENYRSALLSFRNYTSCKDVMLDNITSELMQSYETWLLERRLTNNTSSFYMRILRAVYNRAVVDEIITDRHPFRKVYTGISRTVKRALPIGVMKKIKSLNLVAEPRLDFARDMFMLSFFLRGMSFIDMAYLKKHDLVAGRLTYRRSKTGQILKIKWTSEMQQIVDKYPESGSDYLLPIISRTNVEPRNEYRRIGNLINRNLKTIGRRLNVAVPLTLYVARHTWASVAKLKGIPVSIISECMGHDSEMTTRIYLATLDTGAVARANAKVIHSL